MKKHGSDISHKSESHSLSGSISGDHASDDASADEGQKYPDSHYLAPGRFSGVVLFLAIIVFSLIISISYYLMFS
ncbi:MAG: hypothetical protein IMF14_08155 [Proteobacteria bacterium]|nr:hypothetical protein [Pseudomonadota bacterium]